MLLLLLQPVVQALKDYITGPDSLIIRRESRKQLQNRFSGSSHEVYIYVNCVRCIYSGELAKNCSQTSSHNGFCELMHARCSLPCLAGASQSL
jgi:hypothetical protein